MALPQSTLITAGVAVAVAVGLYGWGYHGGKQSCAAERAEAITGVAMQTQLQAERAAGLSLRVNDIGLRLRLDLRDLRTKGDAVVTEVTTDVATHPDLAACRVPDRTRQLRQQQVADSAALAAARRPM